MAYRIAAKDYAIVATHQRTIGEMHSKFVDAIEALNFAISEHSAKVAAAAEALDAAKLAAADFLEDLHRGFDDEFQYQSERFRESDRGQSIQSWMDEIESQVLNLQELTEWVTPEEIDADQYDCAANRLDDLYQTPEEV